VRQRHCALQHRLAEPQGAAARVLGHQGRRQLPVVVIEHGLSQAAVKPFGAPSNERPA